MFRSLLRSILHQTNLQKGQQKSKRTNPKITHHQWQRMNSGSLQIGGSRRVDTSTRLLVEPHSIELAPFYTYLSATDRHCQQPTILANSRPDLPTADRTRSAHKKSQISPTILHESPNRKRPKSWQSLFQDVSYPYVHSEGSSRRIRKNLPASSTPIRHSSKCAP